jgi:uncharacterized Zn-finger protein
MNNMNKKTIIETSEDTVYCDGYDPDLDDDTHPRVFYTLKERPNGEINAVCFYCGIIFKKV